MNGFFRAEDVTATGDALANPATGQKFLGGARLAAAAATATAIIRETDGSGRILARLSAVANTADDFQPGCPVAFTGKVHVTLSGAGAGLTLYEG